MDSFLTTEEAARRLGVTVKTLYVYVSRGLIESHREKGTRPSYFSRDDVERLATRPRRRSTLGSWNPESGVTSIRPDGIRYRGELLSTLVDQPFEDVAEHLWQMERGDWAARPLKLPKRLSAIDQVRCGVVIAGSLDTFRSDQRPEAVVIASRRLLAGLAQTLAGPAMQLLPADASIARCVAAALCNGRPSEQLVRTVNTAMVLLADHSMSTSTLAVRLGASLRADLYSSLLAGLGVHMGPFFGASSEAAVRLLRYASEVGVDRAVDEELRWRGSLPGFGVPIHPGSDPRFETLLPSLERLLSKKDGDLLNELLACIDRQQLPHPNVDLSLALIVHSAGADASFGPAIFAMARIAGWVAHYLEELEERMGRYYSGPTYPTNWLRGADPS